MTTIYLAGPLFNLAEQEFNRYFSFELIKLRPELKIILPQERAKLLLQQKNGLKLIFQDCLNMVDQSDVIVAILDGPDTDSGTSVELGYALARNKPIIGIRTDFRGSEDRGLNLMVSHVCSTLILEHPNSVAELATRVVLAVESVIPVVA
jgi:nucleoside 2-deoxyribosyltransferase